jgi:hypothetical protein
VAGTIRGRLSAGTGSWSRQSCSERTIGPLSAEKPDLSANAELLTQFPYICSGFCKSEARNLVQCFDLASAGA